MRLCSNRILKSLWYKTMLDDTKSQFHKIYCPEICILSESHARQQATYSLLLHPQLADVYGNVFCIRLGRDKTVFVSGWKMVKETIVTQADNFVDRPYSPMVTRIYSGNSGQSNKHTVHQY